MGGLSRWTPPCRWCVCGCDEPVPGVANNVATCLVYQIYHTDKKEAACVGYLLVTTIKSPFKNVESLMEDMFLVLTIVSTGTAHGVRRCK